MGVVDAVRGDQGSAQAPLGLELREGLVVAVPDREATLGDRVRGLELSPQERGDHLARAERGAELDPGVFLHLAAGEAAPVGALLPDDLGPLPQPGVVDEQGSALPAGDVLGLMEAERAELAHGPQGAAAVSGEQPLGRILDDE